MSDVIRIYKNSKMFKDMIVIEIRGEDVTHTEDKGAYVELYHEDHLVGVNVFDENFSKHFDEGFNYPNDDKLKIVNEYLKSDYSYNANKHLMVAEVLSFEAVENSDKLNLCDVSVGDATYSVVCGAANVEKGMKTIVALDNALLPTGVLIKSGSVFGTASDGMLCSKKELGLHQNAEEKGIIKLDEKEAVGLGFFDIDWRP